MSTELKGFKRINFFKGFLTTEHDWNAAEAYHIQKRKLHNQVFHSPGVVRGYGGELRVVARARGDLSVEVHAGFAIDGQGHDLALWDAVIKNINAEEYRLPQTIYIVLRFAEELSDFIAYKENVEYKGHRRVLERASVEISQTEPDVNREVELARIYLEKGATRIRDARDPDDPRANEIDLRFVPAAGVAGARLEPAMKLRVENVLWQLRSVFLEYSRRHVLTAHDLLTNANTALMLISTNVVDLRNIFDIFYLIVESEAELCLDVEVNHPGVQQKKEFADYKRHVEVLRGLIAEGKTNAEALTNLLAYQAKASEVAELAIAGEQRVRKPAEEDKPVELKAADLSDWESVKALPRPENEMELEGRTWVLVDDIDILDKDSEKKHAFTIKDAKDSYRSRQKLKYPDGTVVEDTGRAQVGGQTSFTINNLTPGRPAVILRRMDYVYGDYELEYHLDGKAAGTISCSGTDRIHRWRNWPFMIDGEVITKASHTVLQNSVTAGRDVNMFHIWVYQPK